MKRGDGEPIPAVAEATTNLGSAADESGPEVEAAKWALFGRRYGVVPATVRAASLGQAVPAILVRQGTIFTGEINALRILRYGRFGNNFYQILNSVMLAQAMGCALLEIPELDDGPEALPIQIGTISIDYYTEELKENATLCASFYWFTGMEAALKAYSASFANRTVEKFVRPLYGKFYTRPNSLGDHVLAMHFRGGDIFAKGTSAFWYVQPPASYYIKTLEYARLYLGVTAVHLVYEDKTNPAVDIVLNHLAAQGIAHTCQSSTQFDDVTTLMRARHIAASFSTFCEAIALLSTAVKTYFAFRQVSSQQRIEFWAQSRVGDMLAARGVKTITIDDPDRSYINAEAWYNGQDQLALMRRYPSEKLRVTEGR